MVTWLCGCGCTADLLSVDPIRLFAAFPWDGHPSYEPIYVHHTRMILSIKHLTHMLIVFVSSCRKGFGVGIAVAAVGIVGYLLVFDFRPYFGLEEVQVCHVFIAADG